MSRAIADLRSAFGESAGDRNYIRTIPKFGYQLVADTAIESAGGKPSSSAGLAMTLMGAAAAVAVLAWIGLSWQWSASPREDLRLQQPTPLTADPGLEHQPRFIANGGWVVFAALRPHVALAQGGRQDLSLRWISHSNYVEIAPEETKVLLLEVRNTGTEAVREIELSALHPEGWRVTIEPDRIAALNPADSIVVEVTIQTPQQPAQERHEIILRADSSTVHRATSVWVTVETRG